MRGLYILCAICLVSSFFSILLIFTYSGSLRIPTKNNLKDCTDNDLFGEVLKGPLKQNNSRLLAYIWSQGFLRPPSEGPYVLSNPGVDPSEGQAAMVRHALSNQRGGFFVEAGALDGEIRSNTLTLEMELGWKGLLIEGDPKNYQLLEQRGRKAWISSACLSIFPHPHQTYFEQKFNRGRISNEMNPRPNLALVQCFPLFSLLAALNVSIVDYLSLDVEGSELDVLSTIPFESLYVRVLSIEYVHVKGGRSAVEEFMTRKGFRVFGEVKSPHNLANDLMFINKQPHPFRIPTE